MVEAVAKLRLVDGYVDGLNTLWDLREADLSTLSVEDMQLLVKYMEQTPKRRSVRIAILARRVGDFLILRLWREVSLSWYGQETRLFWSREEGCQWLEEP